MAAPIGRAGGKTGADSGRQELLTFVGAQYDLSLEDEDKFVFARVIVNSSERIRRLGRARVPEAPFSLPSTGEGQVVRPPDRPEHQKTTLAPKDGCGAGHQVRGYFVRVGRPCLPRFVADPDVRHGTSGKNSATASPLGSISTTCGKNSLPVKVAVTQYLCRALTGTKKRIGFNVS